MNLEIVWHLEKLPYFLKILELGSIRKASLSLGIAQPALSKSLQNLEAATGGTLFHRQRSGVVPTELGFKLAQYANEVMKLSREFSSSGMSKSSEKTLRFVTHEVLGALVFPALKQYSNSPIKTLFEIQTQPSIRGLVNTIESWQADCGVIAEPPPKSKLLSIQLFSDEFGFFAAKSYCREHKIEEETSFDFEKLSRLSLIWAPQVIAGNQETLADKFAHLGYRVEAPHQVNSLESVIELTRLGFGIGIIPKRLALVLGGQNLKLVKTKNSELRQFGKHSFYFCCRPQSWDEEPSLKSLYREMKREISLAIKKSAGDGGS